tara:strand:+ start:762 stop:1703 length:942 start_codon:yes stop_codon:yes gene_type:complete
MATNYSTYDAKGNREDLTNDIHNVDPSDTPFMSTIDHVTATNTAHDWQTDTLSAASNNARVEGFDATSFSADPTVRLSNYTQISSKEVKVTGSQGKADIAGKADEMDYQMLKKGKELKTDMELALLSNKPKVAGDSSSVARELAGIESWIHTNVNSGAGAVEATGDGTDARTGGTPRSAAESQFKDVIKKAWDNGGKPDLIMCGSFNKQAISGFTGNASLVRNTDASAEKLDTAINVYGSDFGDFAVIPSRLMNQSSSLILDTDLFALGSYRDFMEEELANTGDNEKKMLVVEYTLESRNEKGSGAVYDLTVA